MFGEIPQGIVVHSLGHWVGAMIRGLDRNLSGEEGWKVLERDQHRLPMSDLGKWSCVALAGRKRTKMIKFYRNEEEKLRLSTETGANLVWQPSALIQLLWLFQLSMYTFCFFFFGLSSLKMLSFQRCWWKPLSVCNSLHLSNKERLTFTFQNSTALR